MKQKDIVKNYIKNQIAQEKWKGGDKIFSESQFIQYLPVSRTTVRGAISDLIKDGLLVSRQGAGTFISHSFGENKNILIMANFLSSKKIHSSNMLVINKLEEKFKTQGYNTHIFYDRKNNNVDDFLFENKTEFQGVVSVMAFEENTKRIEKRKIPIVQTLGIIEEGYPIVKISQKLWFDKFLFLTKKYRLKNVLVFIIKQSIHRKSPQSFFDYAIEAYFTKQYNCVSVPLSQIHTIRDDFFDQTMKNLKKIPDAILFFDENLYKTAQSKFEKYDNILSKTKIITHSSGNLEITQKYKTCILEYDLDILTDKTVSMLIKLIEGKYIEKHIINIGPNVLNEEILGE